MRLGSRVAAAAKAAIGIFSENSLKEAAGMLTGIMPGGMGAAPRRGVQEYLRAYREMPWLRAVAERIATSVSATEWQLFVLKKSGQRARKDARLQTAPMYVRRKMLVKAAAEGELTQLTDHPLLTALHGANSFQTGQAMRKVTQLHLDLVGEAFWLKERDALGTIVQVWPVPPNWIIALPTPSFRFFRVGFRGWRGNIPDTEFVWFANVDPENPYGRGTGIAMSLADELETDEYAAKHVKSFFYNRARPDLIVWPEEGTLHEPEVRRVEQDWLARTQGFWRAFKPYFMGRKVGIKELDQNFRALTLVPLRQFERDTIQQTFGMPPEIMGILENSNRATISAADYFMARYLVEPRLEFQRSVMQERLVPEYDDRLILEYPSPVQDDQAQQLDAAKSAPWALTVDEWRKLQGHKPLYDEAAGALHMVPFNVTPTALIETALPAPRPPGSSPGLLPGEPGSETVPPEGRPKTIRAIDLSGLLGWSRSDLALWTDDVVDGLTCARDAGDVELAGALAKALADAPEDLPPPSRVAARLEPALARGLAAAWRDHAVGTSLARLEAALGAAGTVGDVLDALRPAELAKAQTAVLDPRLQTAVLRGAALGAEPLRRAGVTVRTMPDQDVKDVTIDFEAVNPEAVRWAAQHAAALVDAPAAVRTKIRALVARSIDEGIAPDELARMLRDVIGLTEQQATAVANFRHRLADEGVDAGTRLGRVTRYAEAQRRLRALTIARTELISALNFGQQALWRHAEAAGAIQGAHFRKQWITTDDERLEPDCEALGNIPQDELPTIDAPFPGTDVLHPPLHVNCRCAMGLVPIGKSAGLITRRQMVERDRHGRITAMVTEMEG